MAFRTGANRFLDVLLAVGALAYPFVVFFGLRFASARPLALALLILLGFRLLRSRNQVGNASLWPLLLASIPLLLGAVLDSHQFLLWQPVVINYGLASVFGSSLLGKTMPIVEKLARLRDPCLPPMAIRYCRKVTSVWTAFFLVNGSIALYTVLFCDFAGWTLYNGFIAYMLIGILAGTEYLIRRQKICKQQQNPADPHAKS